MRPGRVCSAWRQHAAKSFLNCIAGAVRHLALPHDGTPMALLERGWSALLVSLGESAPFVVLGLLLAGVIREFVPAAALKKRMGGLGLAPVLRSVGLGAVLPICSCSTIPLGLGMKRSGAPSGTALAFMTSAPAVSPVTLVLGFSLLGPALLATYATAVVCGACLIGLMGNYLLREGDAPDDSPPEPAHCGCGCNHDVPTAGTRLAKAVRWSLFDLGSEVSMSLLAGLAIATIILVFTPDEWVLGLVGQPGPLAILAVILLALPAYTCSVPALLIAGSLIAKGADPSVAVAFLIAGPATNLGELNAIRVGLGMKAAAYYFMAVMLLAVVGALTVGALPHSVTQPRPQVAESSHHQHRHLHFGDTLEKSKGFRPSAAPMSTWRWPFVLCIGALACHAIMIKTRKEQKDARGSQSVQPSIIRNVGLVAPDGQGGKL